MGKKHRRTKFDFESAHFRLRNACFKLQSMAYLIESHCRFLPASGDDDNCYGVSLILKEILDPIVQVARELDREDVQHAYRKKAKRSE